MSKSNTLSGHLLIANLMQTSIIYVHKVVYTNSGVCCYTKAPKRVLEETAVTEGRDQQGDETEEVPNRWDMMAINMDGAVADSKTVEYEETTEGANSIH